MISLERNENMRDWFILMYEGRYIQCVALPLDWGRRTMRFTQVVEVFLQELSSYEFHTLG